MRLLNLKNQEYPAYPWRKDGKGHIEQMLHHTKRNLCPRKIIILVGLTLLNSTDFRLGISLPLSVSLLSSLLLSNSLHTIPHTILGNLETID